MCERYLVSGVECHTAEAAEPSGIVFGNDHTESVSGQMEGKAYYEERKWGNDTGAG